MGQETEQEVIPMFPGLPESISATLTSSVIQAMVKSKITAWDAETFRIFYNDFNAEVEARLKSVLSQ